MYTTPLFPLSWPPPLCRWHSTVFHPLNFDSSISHIQNALQQIAYWMTANILTFNSSKTELLLMKLNTNLPIVTRHLPLCSNSWLHLWQHLTFSDQSTSLSKACYYHIRPLRCIRPYLDSSTACTTTTSIVHSKLDYCKSVTISTINFLSLNYPVSSIRNSLTRTVTVISLPSYALFTAWLRITERIEYKLLSLTYITRPTVFPLIEAPGFY